MPWSFEAAFILTFFVSGLTMALILLAVTLWKRGQ
jgi:hypothetical protein